jgi:hypothetical protein
MGLIATGRKGILSLSSASFKLLDLNWRPNPITWFNATIRAAQGNADVLCSLFGVDKIEHSLTSSRAHVKMVIEVFPKTRYRRGGKALYCI